MDQIQIGRFIASCRKEAGMTQAQLAEKLGITNRAVSKWETGNSMPDASLMLALCGLLKLSVNELLCGKRLTEREEKTEAQKNTLTLLVAKKDIDNFRILTEILIFSGIVVATTLTAVLAKTAAQKAVTLCVGGFVWGFGLWMRVQVQKAIRKIS